MRASLTDVIAEALSCIDAPPPNEAATRHWVIDPLLERLGYRLRSNAAQFLTDFPEAAKARSPARMMLSI